MISAIRRGVPSVLLPAFAAFAMFCLLPLAAQAAQGNWFYEEFKPENEKLMLSFAYGIPSDEEILLIVSCDNSELYVIAQPQWWLTLDESTSVRYSFDDGDVTHDKWDVLMQQQAVQRGTEAIDFANLMVESDTLAIEIGNRWSEFDLKGSFVALSPVFEQCNIQYLF